jgi:hypothetical protein
MTAVLSPATLSGVWFGQEFRYDWLCQDAPSDEVSSYLYSFDSYQCTDALVWLMLGSPPRRALRLWQEHAHDCDAPWRWRNVFADRLRQCLAELPLVEVLEGDALAFYQQLADPVPVWRGCQRGRERGLSWTTDQQVAREFAQGKRCINENPTLVNAAIPKPHIFGIHVDRSESEISLDPRRLRRLKAVPVEG